MKWLFPIFFVVFSSFAFAKKFSTSYVSFDLLNNWHCHPEGTEWICTSKLNRKKASEAMIILTAKQKGPADSLAQYINHLKSPRTIKVSRAGRGFTSKVFHAKQRLINQHMWVDGFHQGSEVPVYYTRYLVTIKGSLSVLVTYSAHKDHYKKYASDFASSINSLRVMNVSPDFASKQGGSMGMGGMQDYLQDMIDAEDELGGDQDGDGDGMGGLFGFLKKPEALVGLGLIAAILTYLFLKKRKKRKMRLDIDKKSSSRRSRGSDSRHRSSRSSSERKRSSSRSGSSSSRHRQK